MDLPRPLLEVGHEPEQHVAIAQGHQVRHRVRTHVLHRRRVDRELGRVVVPIAAGGAPHRERARAEVRRDAPRHLGRVGGDSELPAARAKGAVGRGRRAVEELCEVEARAALEFWRVADDEVDCRLTLVRRLRGQVRALERAPLSVPHRVRPASAQVEADGGGACRAGGRALPQLPQLARGCRVGLELRDGVQRAGPGPG